MLRAILKDITNAPAEFQILPEGKIEIEGEPPAYLDEANALDIIAKFESQGKDMVIDYEHQTLKDVQAPAAGWIKQLIWKGKEGLWAAVEWTERAKEYLENREYRYFSPVFWFTNDTRKVVQIDNVALTNSPKLNHLKPVIAKMEHGRTNNENNHKTTKEAKMINKLKKLLGLTDDADEGKVLEAAGQLVAKNKTLESRVACKEVLEAVGAKEGAGKEEVIRLVASLKAPGDAAVQLSRQVAELTQEIAKLKQEDLTALALKEGKTSPEELDKWGRDLALKSPEQFRMIVLSRPAGSVVPLEKINHTGERRAAAAGDELVLQVAKSMGNSPEDIKKYNHNQEG